jgi:hypothetical protein
MNPFNLETDLGWQYSLDYLCAFHVLFALNWQGYRRENDDKVIIADRVLRGHAADANLNSRGILKPSWWARSAVDDRLAVQGNDEDLEMRVLGMQAKKMQEDESGSWWWQRKKQEGSESSSKYDEDGASSSTYYIKGSSMLETEDPPLRRRTSQTLNEQPSYSTFDSSKPQVVKSMLDI